MLSKGGVRCRCPSGHIQLASCRNVETDILSGQRFRGGLAWCGANADRASEGEQRWFPSDRKAGLREAQVFISYAREDESSARKIDEILSRYAHVKVWFDRRSLLPGADWKFEIAEAIDNADAILLLLSDTSVSKTGYVQREIREAIERLTLLPPGARLVIPVRLANCRIPHRALQGLNWVDLFPKWQPGLNQLLTGLGLDPGQVRHGGYSHRVVLPGSTKYGGRTVLFDLAAEIDVHETEAQKIAVPPIACCVRTAFRSWSRRERLRARQCLALEGQRHADRLLAS